MEDSIDPDLTHECLIHDLNNVFETITEAAELLSSDRQWRSLAATLRRSVDRGKRLVGAIPDHTPDLAAVIDDAIQSAQDFCITARKPRIEFLANLSAGIPLPGSAKEWERVFANLFLNAAQAFRRPGLIEIAAEREEDNLKILVADNGPGIPEEILSRVFRPNVSTKPGSTRRSGLGLHIVASIVRRYDGKVTAGNREKSSGAVFTISLPFATARSQAAEQ
ncbi:MAG TPA: ATP-binding protein [Bryobacteraceae bacterium]|jgi:signal transduction histidine kinase|nr:ATP-binding protein [Bryobacteraceae bacterium]